MWSLLPGSTKKNAHPIMLANKHVSRAWEPDYNSLNNTMPLRPQDHRWISVSANLPER